MTTAWAYVIFIHFFWCGGGGMYRISIIPNTVFFPVLFIVVVAFILARMIIHFFTHKIVVIGKYMNFRK